MIERIDNELKRISDAGRTAVAIHVGSDLYADVAKDPDQVVAADLLSDGQTASVQEPFDEPTEYNDISLILENNQPADYLHIDTEG
jgi:Mg-chelatase subunit ChlD